MVYLFLTFEHWLMKMFGYDFVVHFEDTLLFCSGIFLGMVIMACLSGNVLYKIKKLNSTQGSNLQLFRLNCNNDTRFFIDSKNTYESIEILLILIFSPFFTRKQYSLRDTKRTKLVIICLILFGILIIMLAIISINTILVNTLLNGEL